ncbi:MAG: serine hydrolase [Chloroflexota bacterium]|nr:serine hydrolase [Chloroflexota bacterium]MDE2910755.1 serine hydrolase [Chloroflexota bacterium]
MNQQNHSKFDRIAAQVESWREELGVPGATFGLSVDGEIYTSGVGVTHCEHPLAVTDETIFQIGSITKTVTATAMMRLVEQGALDLRAPVRDYLPGFRVRDADASASVTSWHLLTHRAGWTGDVFTDTGGGDDAAAKYVEGMANFEQLAPLGRHFSYNNAGFCVAGRVIEALTGASYETAIQELIFEPLGMARSFFFPQQAMLHRFAVGHQAGGRVLSPWAIPRGMNAAGGISCHIHDLLRYGAFHLGDGSPLLERGFLAEMHKPQAPSLPYMGACGLAWMISGHNDDKRLGHTGGTNGQNAVLTLAPARQLALGMMTNGEVGQALHERFNKAVLSEFCQIEIAEARAIESSVAELAQYVGRYQGTMRAIELRLDAGRLLADIRFRGGLPSDRELEEMPPAEVARCGEDQLLVLDGPFKGTRADILRDEAGEIGYLRFGSRLNPRR